MRPRSRSRHLAAAFVLFGLVLGGITAGPAGAATQANRNYIRSLYADLLDRPNDVGNDAGVEFWADRLEMAGQTRAKVARSIMTSTKEYYGAIVDLGYAIYLDRDAEPSGRDFYIERWRNRSLSLDAIVIALAGSNEYYNRVGGTDEAFVENVYFDILGHAPDDGGRAYSLGVVASSGRKALIAQLVRSREERRQTVVDQYGTLLGRVPSASERDFWVERLGDGLRREDFDIALVTSNEYYNANS